jgi:hypothetical protein
LKIALVLTGPESTRPVASNRFPCFVKTAMRELTVCTMWSGPTARLLSEGFRSAAVLCGPSKPTPMPSKLATSAAGGRVPGAVCSMSIPAITPNAIAKAANFEGRFGWPRKHEITKPNLALRVFVPSWRPSRWHRWL